jgi:hypothetical protein
MTRRLPSLNCHPSIRRIIAAHFRGDADRDGQHNKYVDGGASHEIIEVDGGHARYPSGFGTAGRFLCADVQRFDVPSKQQWDPTPRGPLLGQEGSGSGRQRGANPCFYSGIDIGGHPPAPRRARENASHRWSPTEEIGWFRTQEIRWSLTQEIAWVRTKEIVQSFE